MLRTAAAVLAALLAAAATGPAAADLQREVEKLVTDAELGPTTVGMCVARLTAAGPEVLVEVEADTPLAPASNMKLVTTAIALDRLGPGFAFETPLSVFTEPDGGGRSLLVVGSGDPGFGDPELLAEVGLDPEDVADAWVEAVKQTGHTRFERLLLDDAIFDRTFIHPDWPTDQLNRWYCAEVAGINFNDNCIDVLYRPGASPGSRPSVQVFPTFPAMLAESRNLAETGEDDAFWVSRPLDANRFTFRGTVAAARTEPLPVTVHDPPLFFGRYLAHKLDEAGIEVGEVRVAAAPPGVEPERIHVVRSTMAGVMDRTNRDSQNLFSEALFKRIGHEHSGEPGSFENAAAAGKAYLGAAVPGVDLAGVVLSDGSGLARTNRLTPRLLVGVLAHVAASPPEAAALYRSSLAELGETGTLARRGAGVEASRVFAKTGYISRVSALSGYLVVPASQGDAAEEAVYAFSMLFNGFEPPLSNRSMKKVQDDLLALLDEQLAAAAVAAQ